MRDELKALSWVTLAFCLCFTFARLVIFADWYIKLHILDSHLDRVALREFFMDWGDDE